MFYICFSIYIWNENEGEEKVAKKVISIETGIQWTKVALVDYRKKNPPVHEAFAFRTPEHAVEDGYIRDKDSLARALKEELVRRQIVEKDVVFTLSSSKVVTREVMIPYVKDNKIKGIIDAQSRDYFPMDISGYTISYSKMDVVEDDGKKQLKLLLVAIPDNLLGNYVSFAQLAGLKVETFDYIGNGCIQLMCDSFVDNAMIIQLEEQATVISILENKKLAFQRVTPYGYGATISTVVDHPILGIDDEERAFDFLLEHNVIFNKPSMPDNGDPAQQEIDQAQADEAYEDLAESLRYHLRIANTALDYYQNQVKQEFVGNVYLVGDGSRFAGIHKLFAQELPLPLQKIDFAKIIDLRNQNGVNDKKKAGKKEHQDYTDPVLEESSNTRQPRAATPVGFLSVIGAAVHPLDAKPKEMQAADSKKNDLHTAYVLLAGSLLLSLLLILGSSVRQLIAHSEHRHLTDQLESLAYVQQTYDESSRVQQEEQVYVTIDDATRTKNEYLLPLIEQLEAELPSAPKQFIQYLEEDNRPQVAEDVNYENGQMLLNFQNVTLLTDPSIPSMSEQTDEESGSNEWTYTVNAYYADVQESEEQADE